MKTAFTITAVSGVALIVVGLCMLRTSDAGFGPMFAGALILYVGGRVAQAWRKRE